MCTIAHTPRLPEHCIEYVKVVLWKDENPFGGIFYLFIFKLQTFCSINFILLFLNKTIIIICS